MESVKKARHRLQMYPKLVAECGSTAVEYARCVALKENVLKGDCAAEFASFKKCVMEAAGKMKTKV